MKSLFKLAVVLLLLFAMVGTASATISNLTIDSQSGDSASYSIAFSWDDDDTSGTVNYNVSITDSSSAEVSGFPKTVTTNSSSYSGPLTAGTYNITVYTESLSDTQITSFVVSDPATLPSPVFTSFTYTSDIANPNVLNVSWNLDWGTLDQANVSLELSNSGWVPVNGSETNYPITVSDPSSDQTLNFRLNNATGSVTSDSTPIEIKAVKFDNVVNTSDTITWTLNTSAWSEFTYNVTFQDNGTEHLPTSTNTNGTITISGLTANTNYTLNIRGNDSNNQSLWTKNNVTTVASVTNFIDNIESTEEEIYEVVNNVPTAKDFSIEADTTFRMNITTTIDAVFTWELIYDNNSTPETVTSQIKVDSSNSTDQLNVMSWKPSASGNYTLKLVVAEKGNTSNVMNDLLWNVTVTEKSTGSRIWQTGMSPDYTWDARSFSGFYYNLDTGEGNESMTITNLGSRTIAKGNITYVTSVSEVESEQSSFGNYSVVGFMGDKYFAGYPNGDSMMKDGYLSKVLIDNNEKIDARIGHNIALEEGYSISVKEIDVNGETAYLVLERDGKEVDTAFARSKQVTSFNMTINKNEYESVKIYVDSVFQGQESSIISIRGLFQISANATKLESGTKMGKMEIDNYNSTSIEMSNHESVSLSAGTNTTLMGKMNIEVADDSDIIRFAPYVEYTDPGIYEIRGTVSDYDSDKDYVVMKWTPLNFEGFYYDIDDDISDSEMIEVKEINGRSIPKGELVYSSTITETRPEQSNWSNYSVIGFMGDKYFAGYIGGESMLKDGYMSKVLVDDNDKRDARLGSTIDLEEGYAIVVKEIDVNGERVYLSLEKDGKQLDTAFVSSKSTGTFTMSINKKDYDCVKVYVDSVFQGQESSIVSIRGIFQISDNVVKLDSDAKYGKMKMDNYNSTSISLVSDENISLSAGNTVEFMTVSSSNSTMSFKVGDDSGILRYAPIVEREIGSNSSLEIEFNQSTVVVGDPVRITVKDRGTTIEGASVTVNGTKIGATNSSGMIDYTPSSVGTVRVTAEKAGFVTGSASLTVNEKLINMTVRVSPDTIYFGTVGTIKATDSLNGSAIGDATVYISGESIGRTNSSGELNYTFNKTGNVTIDVVKEKYNNGTTSINVSQEVAFAYANFALKPDSPSAKKAIKLTFDVTNNGIKDGSHDLSLILKDSSGNVVDQDNSTVSANMGKSKSVSLSVKAPEEGTYTLTLVETDSNRTIDLPSSMATVPVGEAKFGSTILYIVLAFLAIIVIAVIGFVAYLFGVKGATKDNYKMVAQEVVDDIKSKFQRK